MSRNALQPGMANVLFVRAVLAFLLLPGIVAGVIPGYMIRPRGQPLHVAGAVILAIGAVLLLWCVRDFYVAGKGTLAPWDPPRSLVVVGLYRYSRNPMYLSVLVVLAGWAIGYRSGDLAWYAVAAAIVFHVRVVLFEEPTLARLHGAQWDQYRARVRRWL